MNICFLEGDMSRSGGTERMTALLANALSEKNKVYIISLFISGKRTFFSIDSKVTHKVLASVTGKRSILKNIAEIRHILKEKKIDCVINVDTGMGIYGILAAAGTSCRVITWEHANYYNNWNSRIFPYLRRFAARHSDMMVVLTERDRKNYCENIKTKTPIYVIPNPAARHAFNYDIHSKMILSAGALLPIKGYDHIIEIGKRVFAVYPEWEWHICGEGPEQKKLEQGIEEAELTKNIYLDGNISHMENHYRKSAMFVMTSHMEGLPMVLLEAKSYGLPLVSYDIMTGPSDIIRDGKNGYLIPPEDISAMAEKILLLMENEEVRYEMSSNSKLDMEKFDWKNILDKWEKILKNEKEKNTLPTGSF